jgi:hypothetical protein
MLFSYLAEYKGICPTVFPKIIFPQFVALLKPIEESEKDSFRPMSRQELLKVVRTKQASIRAERGI